jgi:succinate dehydrogenase / fumarate reductase cytochrome b subunit
MALSGFFLLFFLLQHFSINMISVISEDGFNTVSHFMGHNPIVQFGLQPVLIFGVIFHLAMGMYLEFQNTKARNKKYAQNNGAANSSWMSRNMIITGLMVLAFIVLHFLDFWIPELIMKYGEGNIEATRYYGELQHKFVPIWRVAAYCVAFVFLSLHLMHGFQSAFLSVGFRHNIYTPLIKKLGIAYAVIIPAGFIFIALFHHFNH